MLALQCVRRCVCVWEEMWNVDELFYLWVLRRIILILVMLTGESGGCEIFLVYITSLSVGKNKKLQIRYIRIRPDCSKCQKHPGGSPNTSSLPLPLVTWSLWVIPTEVNAWHIVQKGCRTKQFRHLGFRDFIFMSSLFPCCHIRTNLICNQHVTKKRYFLVSCRKMILT